ncbi:hypothetical protein HPB49_002963 [Dermacentor silvarum]|uniref:Uncharacterized protein n=1 Tax=Dermacentor silvarum TaxID=543639 RepID=A0ACB8CUU9_DERSI|nr:hypothetical protein HPB49_002963 [Dermacentor silvarum]
MAGRHDVDHRPVLGQRTGAAPTLQERRARGRGRSPRASEQRSNGGFAASPDAAADAEARTCSPTLAPPAPRSAGPQQGKKRPLWQPQPLPNPKATDFVVVLKPRTQLSLATVFPENGAGRALIAHLGATATRLVTVVMVREQNVILTYTSNPQIADKLIGEFAVPSPVGPVPLFGYLRADTQDSCYGVVTVRSSDTEATLRESLYWPEGEILHVRRLGTSNKVRLTFSGKVKPSCPGPKPDLCGICGKAVPLTDGARAPHKCTPRCALCAGPHVTADRCCKERYRTPPPKSPTPPPEGQAGPKKRKRRRPRKPKTGPRASPQRAQPPVTNPTPPPHPDAGAVEPSLRGQTPDGPPTRKSTTRQVSPASPKPHPPSPQPKPTAKGDLSWATRVRQGPQVSSSGGAASPPPPSMIPNPKPPTPSTPTREQIAIRQLQAQVASLTQAVEALANRLPSANPTPSGQAPEAMDSAPSEHRDTTALLAPIEARVRSLEAHVASIVTTIEDRLAAALQTVVDRIPGMIVAQLPKHSFSTSRPKLKRISKSQAPRPPPQVAAVDRQSKVSIATSDVSTGSSSGAPVDLSALLEAPQISSSHDGGQRL